MNTEMLKGMNNQSPVDPLAGIFVCLIDISQSLAQIADNTNYLDPLYNLRTYSESPKTSDQQVTY